MFNLLASWFEVIGLLVFFSAIGAPLSSVLFDRVRFAMLISPFAGMLLLPMLALTCWVSTDLRFSHTIVIAASAMAIVTMVTCWPKRFEILRELRASILVLAGVSLPITVATLSTSIELGTPALLYLDGTDHLGYAHLADWIISHRPPYLESNLEGHVVDGPPRASREAPYESWPSLIFRFDPRAGSFALLGIIATLTSSSGMFSYDLTCAVILTAGVLACASVFTRDPLSLFLLSASLLTAHWFDYGRTGFLGKLIAYPAVIFVFGLMAVVLEKRANGSLAVCLIAMLAGAAGLMHSGIAFAGLYMALALPFTLMSSWRRSGPDRSLFAAQSVLKRCAVATLPAMVAILASGVLARPLAPVFPDFRIPWEVVLAKAADLESVFVAVSGMGGVALMASSVTFFLAYIAILAFVCRAKHDVSAALLVGPLLLIALLILWDGRAAAFQLIGFAYPAALCGVWAYFRRKDPQRSLVFPTQSSAEARGRIVVAVLTLLLIGLHFPRLQGVLLRYAFNGTTPLNKFSSNTFDVLAEHINGNAVLVSTGSDPHFALPVLVELGRRNIQLVWSPASWKAILGYRDWAHPPLSDPPALRLDLAIAPPKESELLVVQVGQFSLYRRTVVSEMEPIGHRDPDPP